MIFKLRDVIDRVYEWQLLRNVRHIPRHIAVIQDGNRRYAREMGIDVSAGHRLGARTTEKVLDWAEEIGVTHMTLYCFSTENFSRSEDELRSLFGLFAEKALSMATDERLHKNRIKIQMLGDRKLLPSDLLEKIERVEELTKDYSEFTINLAIAYGGRNEIVCATRSILSKIKEGRIDVSDITNKTIEDNLYHNVKIPPVDLIIRTGNEKRTSNFLPWLANGNESAVYFCAPYWPMFRKIDLLRGVRLYDQRYREGHFP